MIGSTENVSLVTVTLPESGDSFIVIVIPSNNGGYNPIVISANNPDFKAADIYSLDIYFHNHADQPVLGHLGRSKFALNPAMGTTLRPEGPSGEGKYYDVGLGFRDTEGERTLRMARWPIRKSIRMYVFSLVNSRNQRIDFRAVDEFVEPAQAGG